jgi:hypothetical protein
MNQNSRRILPNKLEKIKSLSILSVGKDVKRQAFLFTLHERMNWTTFYFVIIYSYRRVAERVQRASLNTIKLHYHSAII